jgi:hypothetical protein
MRDIGARHLAAARSNCKVSSGSSPDQPNKTIQFSVLGSAIEYIDSRFVFAGISTDIIGAMCNVHALHKTI